jgi:uncharacterized protein (TIGR00106 family)
MMNVIIDFSIFPMDKGESVGAYASRAVKIIAESGLTYHVSPMGTSIEGQWDEVIDLIGRCLNDLQKDCDRVYMTMKVDYRKNGKPGRIKRKIKTAEGNL